MKTANKFWLVISVITLVFSMAVTGCDDGSTSEPVYDNNFTINGETYKLTHGIMYYFGNYFSESVTNVDFVLYTSDNKFNVYFELLVPNGNPTLVSGTYNLVLNEQYKQTFAYVIGYVNTSLTASSGTVNVSVSGSANNAFYVITIDCTLVDEDDNPAGTIKGTYGGRLGWELGEGWELIVE